MYRMLIVDDKPHERRGIQEVIDWQDAGIEIVGACANGKQAIQKTEQQKPDIILADIAMPVMNGIEMAEQIMISHPHIKIIFMSCYHDFNFARSAVELNISGYVLKPIIPEELKKTVQKVVRQLELQTIRFRENDRMLEEIRNALPLVREQFLKELLLGNFRSDIDICSRMEFLGFDIGPGKEFRVAALSLRRQEDADDIGVADKYLVTYTVKNIINNYSSGSRTFYPIQLSENEYAVFLICSVQKKDTEKAERLSKITEFIEALTGIHDDIFRKLGYTVMLGISMQSPRATDIPLLDKQAKAALNTVFYSNTNPIIFYDDVEELDSKTDRAAVNMEEMFQEIKSAISCGTRGEIELLIDRYFSQPGQNLSESYAKGMAYTIVNMVLLILMESGKSFRDIFDDEGVVWEKLSRFNTIVNLRQWLLNMLLSLKDYLEAKTVSNTSRIVDVIRETVQRRYHEPLKVSDIVKEVFLSTRYCNEIFKRETGQTIFDYLMEYRIEMAKKLLKESESKVSVVAEHVGYDNISYFCLLFKKCTGLTPAEYKSRAVI